MRYNKKKINICFFNGNMSNPGGTQKCTTIIANELAKNDSKYNVFIIDCSNFTNKHSYFEISKKIKYYSFHCKSKIKQIVKLRSFLKFFNIDFLINVEAMLGIYTIPGTLFLKTKNIIWEHGNYYQKQSRYIDLIRWIEIKTAYKYITLTQRDQSEMRKHFSGRCSIETIYNPIIFLEEEPNYNVDSKMILSVGMIRHIKGYDIAVKVASEILKKYKDWYWIIIGDGPDKQKIEKEIIHAGLINRMVIIRNVKNIDEYYKKASIFISTSRMEGLPMTMLEAKSLKLPIISFDIYTGPSEIILNSVNGFLIEPFHVKNMIDHLSLLIENIDLRKRMSENAYINIDNFSYKTFIDKWLRIFNPDKVYGS